MYSGTYRQWLKPKLDLTFDEPSYTLYTFSYRTSTQHTEHLPAVADLTNAQQPFSRHTELLGSFRAESSVSTILNVALTLSSAVLACYKTATRVA